jgi:hypothetical protein
MKTKAGNELPKYLRAGDLKASYWPSKKQIPYKDYEKLGITKDYIDLWNVSDWGWVIPTLLIKKAGQRSFSGIKDRNYGIRLDNLSPVRVGMGPHVGEVVRVHLNKTNLKRLQPLLDAMKKGTVMAHEARDRRSTRALRRFF